MTHQQPTAADFFAQPAEDDEAFDVAMEAWKAAPGLIMSVPPSPLERIASALEAMMQSRPITIYEDARAQATAAEMARLLGEREHLQSAVGQSANKAPTVGYAEVCEALQATEQELADTDAKLETAYNVINEVANALGKSTAKPALAAKAVIEEWRNPQVPSVPEGEDEPPSPPSDEPDAPVTGHTRAETDAGPAICQECSYAASDWVQWPCEAETADRVAGESEAPSEPVQPVQPAHDAPVEEWREYARAQGYAGPGIDKANRSQIRTALGIAHTG